MPFIVNLIPQVLAPSRGVQEVVPTRRYCGSGTYDVQFRRSDETFKEEQLPCRYYDGADAVYPYIEKAATYVSTRIQERIESVNGSCAELESPDCLPYNVTESTNYFVADPDLFTVKLDHALYVTGRDISASGERLPGELVQRDGTKVDECRVYKEMDPTHWEKLCREESKVSFGTPHTPDIIPFAALMDAAGLFTLYRESMLSPETHEQPESLRYTGFIMVVTIDYSNAFPRTKSFRETSFHYRATVEVIDGLEFKGEQIVPSVVSDDRLRRVLNRHGIRVVVTQAGSVGFFDFQQLLIQLVTSMGLLAVSSMVVNFLAMNVFEMKHIYSKYETVTSVDFGDLGHLPEPTLRRFKTEDLINPRPAIFAEVESKDAGGMTANARREPQVTVRESRKPQRGFFGGLGRENVEEEEDEEGRRFSTINPVDARILEMSGGRRTRDDSVASGGDNEGGGGFAGLFGSRR